MREDHDTRTDCPSDAQLAAFMENAASQAERDAVAEHVSRCPRCYEIVRETLLTLADDPDAQATPQKPVRRARSVYLALAATLVTAVGSYALLRPRMTGETLAMRPLVDAVGERRFFEPRLVGGFHYGPPVPATRGSADSQSWAVLGVAARLEEAARAQPTIPHRSAFAAALVFAKEYDASIHELRALTTASPDDAGLWTNLAAAYLVRSEANNQDADTAQALEAAARALELNPNLPEAAWNKALALERLGFVAEARTLAERFRSVEHDGWRSAWDGLLQRLPPTQRSEAPQVYDDPVAMREMLETNADDVRSYFHCTLLPRVLEGDSSPAAQVIADAFLSKGDHYVADTLSWALSAREPAAQMAVDTYVRGQRAYEVNDFGAAEPLLVAAAAQAPGPLATTADLHRAIVEYWRSDFRRARQTLDAVRGVADARRYLFLLARAEWMLGLIDIVEGKVFSGAAHYERAHALFVALGDQLNAGAVSSLISEQERFVGSGSLAWRSGRRARASFPGPGPLRRILVADLNLLLLAADERLWRVAESAAGDALAVVRQGRHEAEESEVLAYVAFVQRRRDRVEESVRTFAAARTAVLRLPEGPVRDRILAQVAERQVEACGVGCSAAELDELQPAFAYFRARGRNLLVPSLLLVAGLAAERRDDVVAAESHYQEGARLLAPAKGATQRIPLNAAAWGIFSRWARLALGQGELDKAMAISDLARRAARGLPAGLPNEPRLPSIQSGEGDVLAFAVLDDALVGCLIRQDHGVECDQEPAAAFEGLRDGYFATRDDDSLMSLSSPGVPLLSRLARSAHGRVLVVAPDPFQPLLPPSVLLGSEVHGRAIAFASSIQSAISFLEGPAAHPALPSGGFALLNGSVPSAVLPGAKSEAASLEGFLGAQRLAGDPEEQLTALAGLPEGTVIHFSGHARVNPDYPQFSALEFNHDGAVVPVTAADIVKHRLPARSLVVLAGCDTATWGGRRGPVTSLASAFVDAGAEIVVSTTRPLPDAQAATCFPSLEAAIVRSGALEALARTSSYDEPCRSLLSTVIAVVG